MIYKDLPIEKELTSLKGKTIFITGFQKNCGKTTFLNLILKLNPELKKGYFSIGIDGERQDSIFKTIKPSLYSRKGDIVVIDSQLDKCDAGLKILDTKENGKIIIAEVVKDGYVEITSPAGNYRISEIVDSMKLYNCELILIDGAFDRFTQITSIKDSNFYYVSRVSPENINSVAEKISLIYSMSKIPVIKENSSVFDKMNEDFFFNGDSVFIKGAVSDLKLKKISEMKKVFIQDFTKVFIDYNRWNNLINEKKVFFSATSKLLGFVINLYNISKENFEKRLKDKEILKYLVYNPYEY